MSISALIQSCECEYSCHYVPCCIFNSSCNSQSLLQLLITPPVRDRRRRHRGHHPHAGHRRRRHRRRRRPLQPRRRRFFVDFASAQFAAGRSARGAGRSTAVGRPERLPGGAGRPGPGQVVGWGHAGADGRSSGGCWEPRCASARAFAPPDQLVEKYIAGTRSYLGCNVEYGSDLGCFGHAKVIYFHVVCVILSNSIR